MDKRDEVCNKVLESGLPVSKIILFGSRAGEDFTVFSDYDICLISPDPWSNSDRSRFYMEVDNDPSINIDVVFVSESVMNDSHCAFDLLTQVKKEGVVLWQR